MLDKKIWINTRFDLKGNLPYPCGSCHQFQLNVTKHEKDETRWSKYNLDSYDERYGPKDEEFLVACFVECKNCRNNYVATGLLEETQLEQHYQEQALERGVFRGEVELKSIYPHLHPFTLPTRCPDHTKKTLREAFSIVFNSNGACANRIRVALEQICDHEGVPKQGTGKKSNKPYDLNLKDRIEELEKRKPQVSLLGEPIRNLGNQGSHTSQLSREDLIDQLYLAEYIVHALYGNMDGELISTIDKHSKPRT